jgi:hypothetical protein
MIKHKKKDEGKKYGGTEKENVKRRIKNKNKKEKESKKNRSFLP